MRWILPLLLALTVLTGCGRSPERDCPEPKASERVPDGGLGGTGRDDPCANRQAAIDLIAQT